jgi:hypothetical protein
LVQSVEPFASWYRVKISTCPFKLSNLAMASEGMFDIEDIVVEFKSQGETYYLVKWDGFDASENTLQAKKELPKSDFMAKVYERFIARQEATGYQPTKSELIDCKPFGFQYTCFVMGGGGKPVGRLPTVKKGESVVCAWPLMDTGTYPLKSKRDKKSKKTKKVAKQVEKKGKKSPRVRILPGTLMEAAKSKSPEASSKKASSKKASSEKASSKKASSEKASSKKASSEKASSKKALSKKAVQEIVKAWSEKASSTKRRRSLSKKEKEEVEDRETEKLVQQMTDKMAPVQEALSKKAVQEIEKVVQDMAASSKKAPLGNSSPKAPSEETEAERAKEARKTALRASTKRRRTGGTSASSEHAQLDDPYSFPELTPSASRQLPRRALWESEPLGGGSMMVDHSGACQGLLRL